MKFLYSLFIQLYGWVVYLAAPFNPKARLFSKGRKSIWEKLQKGISDDQPVIWMHCSSLGEYEQGVPVLDALQAQFPTHQCIISFFSPSGYEVIQPKEKRFVFYLPLDHQSNAKKLLDIIQPDLVIFVKYEFWYHLMYALGKKSIPFVYISAIFRDNQPFFKGWGTWFRKALSLSTHLFVQDENSQKLLQSIDIQQVTISGDTRFDRVKQLPQSFEPIPILEHFCREDALVFVAGSTWPKDEDILIEAMQKSVGIQWVICPHNIKSDAIDKLCKILIHKYIKFSEWDGKTSLFDCDVLVLDTVGILSKVYQYADGVYVGGGFDSEGIHNILEPAVYGKPIIIGPIHEKFFEAAALLHNNAIVEAQTPAAVIHYIEDMQQRPDTYKQIGERAKQYVENQPIATETIMNFLEKLLKSDGSDRGNSRNQ